MNLLEGADLGTDPREEILSKWKDKPAEELLKAKVEADLHIKTLEREKAEQYEMYKKLYEETQTKASLQELIDQMKNEQQVALPIANEVKEPVLDMNKMKDLFKEEISAYETQKREVENFGKVQSKLKEKLGPNYASTLKDQYEQLGLSNDEMNSLAKKSPEAYFRMLGINDSPRSDYMPAPRGAMRNDSFAPKTVKRDYAYYQELKKTNPMLYLDPKIAVQMEKDAQELGAAFGLPD